METSRSLGFAKKHKLPTKGFANADGDSDTSSDEGGGYTGGSGGGGSSSGNYAQYAQKAVKVKGFLDSLTKSGATTGDPNLDKQVCGTKPGIFATGSMWAAYHDCLMNYKVKLQRDYDDLMRLATPPAPIPPIKKPDGSPAPKDGKPSKAMPWGTIAKVTGGIVLFAGAVFAVKKIFFKKPTTA